MNITEIYIKDYSFTGTVVKWKGSFQLSGTFKTSYQDYPNETDVPLYASTVQFVLKDHNNQVYDLTEHENSELEELLNDKIDSFIDENSKLYSVKK